MKHPLLMKKPILHESFWCKNCFKMLIESTVMQPLPNFNIERVTVYVAKCSKYEKYCLSTISLVLFVIFDVIIDKLERIQDKIVCTIE